jgi:CheY-like chemotaxis protein
MNTGAMLEDLGHEVLEATSGDQALRVLRRAERFERLAEAHDAREPILRQLSIATCQDHRQIRAFGLERDCAVPAQARLTLASKSA